MYLKNQKFFILNKILIKSIILTKMMEFKKLFSIVIDLFKKKNQKFKRCITT